MSDGQTPDGDGADVGLTEAERTYGRTGTYIGGRGRWYSEASVERIVTARVAAAVAAERERVLRSPYDEDGYCEGCGNGSWKAHAPNCGWADLRDVLDRAEAAERQVAAVRALADEWDAPNGAPHMSHDFAVQVLRAALDGEGVQ